jgi:hypothetical protein
VENLVEKDAAIERVVWNANMRENWAFFKLLNLVACFQQLRVLMMKD